jgi:hypothetical protein
MQHITDMQDKKLKFNEGKKETDDKYSSNVA